MENRRPDLLRGGRFDLQPGARGPALAYPLVEAAEARVVSDLRRPRDLHGVLEFGRDPDDQVALPEAFRQPPDGGRSPVWTQDGRGVFYLEGVNRIMSTRILSAGEGARAAVPRLAFALPQSLAVSSHMAALGGLTPDGRRVAVVQPDQEWPGVDRRRLVVVPNWVDHVKAKVPAAR